MCHTPLTLVSLALVAACAACGGGLSRQAIPDYSRFSHAWTTPRVTLYWDCTEIESGPLRIDGVGVNLWEPVSPRFLELRAYGINAQGRVLAVAQATTEGVELLKNFPVRFHVELQEQGEEIWVNLAYRYQYWDDSFDGFARWMPTYVTGRVPDACGQGGRQTR